MLVDAVCMGAALKAMVLWSSADAGTSLWSAMPFALVWRLGVALALAFFGSAVDVVRGAGLKRATA